jgi:hypothetical protein
MHACDTGLEHIACYGVLQPREALERLEAFLLRLEHGRERIARGSKHLVGVKGAVGHGGNSGAGFFL